MMMRLWVIDTGEGGGGNDGFDGVMVVCMRVLIEVQLMCGF